MAPGGSGADGAVRAAGDGAHDCGGGGAATPRGSWRRGAATAAPNRDQEQGDYAHSVVRERI